MAGLVPARALVVGVAVTGRSVARHLIARGHQVTLADDRPTDDARAYASSLGTALVEAPSAAGWAALAADTDVVLPSPGVPAHHPVFGAAAEAGVPVWSEFELAARWSDLPVAAITGTNGKTTVTVLVTEMLERSGLKTTAAGNTEVPLIDVLDLPLDVVVVEASSFRLQLTESFAPKVGTWLNLAEDHLDWHGSMASYTAAKARIWARQAASDTAVANADDPVVAAEAAQAPGTVDWFSIRDAVDGGWWWDRHAGTLVGPGGPFVDVADLARKLPHDLANALAATATAVAAGGAVDACAAVLSDFAGLAHRVALVAEAGGVSWYDDSKATTPASVLAAVGGFDSVVLIAGGRNKGLDLSVLRSGAPPVRAVVAIGDSAGDVAQAFAGVVPVDRAASMADAVHAAGELSRPGDAVLLSPGCASFDWYANYAARGDDFARLVLEHTGAAPAPALPSGGGH